MLLAEKIARASSRKPLPGAKQDQLTISMGLESRAPGSARITDLFNQLLMVADDSMIRAKKAGTQSYFYARNGLNRI